MMTNESLNQQVQAYLRDHFSIRLDLPAIEESQTDRIQLNFFKSPIGEKLQENRYRLLINSSEELLRKNIVNTDKIKQFGEIFFEVVNQDIQVLTRNE